MKFANIQLPSGRVVRARSVGGVMPVFEWAGQTYFARPLTHSDVLKIEKGETL